MSNQERQGASVLPLIPPGKAGGGRPPLPKDVRDVKHLAYVEVVRAISKSFMMTQRELTEAVNDPDASMAQRLMGKMLLKSEKARCPQRTQLLLNYVLGKPKPAEDPGEEDGGREMGELREALKAVPASVLLELMTRFKPG